MLLPAVISSKPNLEKLKKEQENNMYIFGKKSLKALSEVDPKLQQLAHEAIKIVDFTVIEGKRTLERQKELVAEGKSKTLKSKHLEGKAIDVAPYPISWSSEPKNLARFYYLIGVFKGLASKLNIKIRLGADWDGDNDFKDQIFDDLPHVELIE